MSISVSHLAALSNLSLTPKEAATLAAQFDSTLKVVSALNKLNTSRVKATPQVTGLNNRFRNDEIDLDRILSQKDALANASHTHHGFFIVPAVLEERS